MINALRQAGGGYLYLPPGRYYLGRSSVRPADSIISEEYADLVVPPEVTLWFAPEAVLVPLAGADWVAPRPIPGVPATAAETNEVRVEIQGDIVAEVTTIFDVQFEEDPGLGTAVGRGLRTAIARPAGRVLLTSLRIRQIRPEWWGALPRRPIVLDPPAAPIDEAIHGVSRTTRAFQAAIDAAYTRRTTPRRRADGTLFESPRQWNVRPAIPIVAPSTYVIDQPLNVFAPNDPRVYPWFWVDLSNPMDPRNPVPLAGGGFELRGDRGIGNIGLGESTLEASTYPTSLFPLSGAMLHIDGPEQVRVEGMTFDGTLQASGGVSIVPSRREWLTHAFEGCTLRNCVGALVALDATVAKGPRMDFWNISFTRCRFEPGDVDQVSERIIRRPPGLRAIADAENNLVSFDLALEDNGGLVLQNCVLFGVASPAIRAWSGRFTLNETVFHLNRMAHPARQNRHTRVDFRHGMDIFIEKWTESSRGYVPAAFTAREVESQSWQFLGTARQTASLEEANRSAVVLLNVTGAPVFNRTGEGTANDTGSDWLPPTLYWDQPGNLGCPLVMIGCRVNGVGPDPANPARPLSARSMLHRTVVIVGPNMEGDIFTVGCGTAFDVRPGITALVMHEFDPTQPLRPPPALPRVRRLTATSVQ